MRGNELPDANLPNGETLFPIPMRGNEKERLAAVEATLDLFPIPMRGNEVTVALCICGATRVSNPHEG